ncbi:MAG: response regulator transcription factor [Blastocatellia bacterium]
MPDRLLLIDDDAELGQMLRELFAPAGFQLDVALNGRTGLKRTQAERHQLILLDVMLPDADGFELCRTLRQQSETPILMLTACGTDLDRIRGLELGADDYLCKPFNPRELVARARAILRRHHHHPAETTAASGQAKSERMLAGQLSRGPLKLDLVARRAAVAGQEVGLTGLEFNLLQLLARHPGQTISREEIIASLHGSAFHVVERSVDVHISSLRKKLAAISGLRDLIKTVRGEGYVFCLTDSMEPL